MGFSDTLLRWYRENRRDLPWRATRDPYRIWVSEIILQQTRVAQGLDYYHRFIERFPDITALALADEDEVLRLWQGLGYYSRARNLHAAAKAVCQCFPNTYEGVRAMKGIGDYTAAAICSIAYGLPYAAVDGNVYRVLSRYFGVETPIDSTQGKKEFTMLAQELLDKKHPGAFNQAIMDFGALQCVPVSPDCFACPFHGSCVAFGEGKVGAFPVKTKRAKMRLRHFNYLYVKAGNATFLHRRSGKDIWKGLYEFPLIETQEALSGVDELLATEAFKKLVGGDAVTVVLRKKGLKHVLSHQTIFANLFEVGLPATAKIAGGFLRIKETDLSCYALPQLLVRLADFRYNHE